MSENAFSIRSKVWVVDAAGNVVFGEGRYRMLRAIERTGSINAAAKELQMSYRAVWRRIQVSEERLGCSLLIRNIGGVKGGGSELTEFARGLMARFKEMHELVNTDANRIYAHTFSSFFTR